MAEQRLYLDHAATTPVLASVRSALGKTIDAWANPSSPHADGRAARACLEDARARVKSALNWDGEVIFTSGASEALAIAMTRHMGDATLVSAVEHSAVHRVVPDSYFLPVQADGAVSPAALAGRLGALKAKAPLVAIQHVNNETGVIQPLEELAPIVRDAGGLLLADCAQSAGKIELPDADIITISGHKFGALPGIGALLVREFAMIAPSGGQEQGYRGGTENIPGAVSMALALEAGNGWMSRAKDLRQHLDKALTAAGGQVIAVEMDRLATIASYQMPGVAASAQLVQFDLAGISISAGSACSSGSLKASPVLKAMGVADAVSKETIRVSFGRDTKRKDIYRFIENWSRIFENRREKGKAR